MPHRHKTAPPGQRLLHRSITKTCLHAITAALARRFGAQRGDYMFHCHNLVHEDDDMLRAFTAVGPQGSVGLRMNADPQFKAVTGANNYIYNNWGYNNPMFGDTAAKLTEEWEEVDEKYTQKQVRVLRAARGLRAPPPGWWHSLPMAQTAARATANRFVCSSRPHLSGVTDMLDGRDVGTLGLHALDAMLAILQAGLGRALTCISTLATKHLHVHTQGGA
jgi:hypothetical protein